MGIQIDYSGLRFASKPSEREFRTRFRDGGRLGRWAMVIACLVLTVPRPLLDTALLLFQEQKESSVPQGLTALPVLTALSAPMALPARSR